MNSLLDLSPKNKQMSEQLFDLCSQSNQPEMDLPLQSVKVPFFSNDAFNFDPLEERFYQTDEYLPSNHLEEALSKTDEFFPFKHPNQPEEDPTFLVQDLDQIFLNKSSSFMLKQMFCEPYGAGQVFNPTLYEDISAKLYEDVNDNKKETEGCEFDEKVELTKQVSHLSNETSEDPSLDLKHDVSFKRIKKKSKSFKIKSKNEEKKNIHRYMIRQVIRSLASEDFKEKVMNLCLAYETDYEKCKQYYMGQIENFISIQLLSEHWSVDPLDISDENRSRMVFKEFSKWFLKERAIRYILNGKMKNPLNYIHYKNHIMLYYIDKPQEYKSNNKKKNVK